MVSVLSANNEELSSPFNWEMTQLTLNMLEKEWGPSLKCPLHHFSANHQVMKKGQFYFGVFSEGELLY